MRFFAGMRFQFYGQLSAHSLSDPLRVVNDVSLKKLRITKVVFYLSPRFGIEICGFPIS